MAKKIPSIFVPKFTVPGREINPLGSQPVPTAPQPLKDRNQNSTKDNSGNKKNK
jgi:hypothetical protein